MVATSLSLLLSAFQPLALVVPGRSLAHEDIERIKDLFEQLDPDSLSSGEPGRLTLTERDLNLLLDYSLRDASKQRSAVILRPGSGQLDYTYELPPNPLGKYVNLSVSFAQESSALRVDHLLLGRSEIPGWALNPALGALDGYLRRHRDEYRGIMSTMKEIQLRDREIEIVYQWQPGLVDTLQARSLDFLLPEADRTRIAIYYAEIARLSQGLQGATAMSRLLQPLFVFARSRTAEPASAVAENKALFLALGLVVKGTPLNKLIGETTQGPTERVTGMKLTLRRRSDLAKHFALSAAISAAGGRGLADAVGIFKELDDSRGGSGFSFADLLADRAGVELAKAALSRRAHDIQRRLAALNSESDYMPGIDQLPEGVSELEFKLRYEDLDSASYALVNDEIERRIATCAVYR